MNLEVQNVDFAYDGQSALRDVSFAVHERQLIALAGQNGSGKSTLLKLMARVLVPSRGEVRVDGRPLHQWPAKDYARNVGYLPQEPDTAFSMRAVDAVVSGRAPFLTRFGWEGESDYRAAEEALAMCDAEYLAERYLDEMSGGERKRVFLARVLAGQPRLVLLDEPFAALDIAHVQQLARLLRQIADRTAATVIFASHDLNWATAYSDRVLAMRDGKVVVDVAPRDLLQPPLIREIFGFEAAIATSGNRSWLVPRV